ncbi:MAG: periplasmic heavy metal sensor [Hylemonella sp.]|nr:periplasmic heavy metal sensor [Hylemonella sp.]MDP1936700.1 periplasmic heavy metal sensor [Hylemonella sp.]
MKPTSLRIALLLSLFINVGVLGAVAYRALVPASTPAAGLNLPRHLQLSAEQLQHWHASETAFLGQLEATATDIRQHRDRLVRAIFAENTDPTLIEAERTAIARLQDEQQKLVIRQLLAERALLNPAQREQLARLLLAQPVGPSTIEQLHRE